MVSGETVLMMRVLHDVAVKLLNMFRQLNKLKVVSATRCFKSVSLYDKVFELL